MLDKKKILEFFDATKITQPIHIVGCGAIGSHICDLVARMGFEKIHLYDFDKVEPHNIVNQRFFACDIGNTKVNACTWLIKAINPNAKVTQHPEGLKEPWILNGIIIMCVDNIETRQKIVKANRVNPNCECILDFRMRMTDAQHYFASTFKEYEELWKTMEFTHEEAKEATPLSACGVVLSVPYTVAEITALGMANLVTYLQKGEYKIKIFNNMKYFDVEAY